MMQRIQDTLVRLGAALTLLALLVAPPALMVRLIGRPWTSWGQLRREISGGQVSTDTTMRVAAMFAIVLWAWAMAVVASEVYRILRARNVGAQRAMVLEAARSGPSGWLQTLVRVALVGTMTTSTLVNVFPSIAVGDMAASVASTVTNTAPAQLVTGLVEVSTVRSGATLVADGTQTPLSIAIDLGDESLRQDIIELNRSNEWRSGVFPAGMVVQLPAVAQALPENVWELPSEQTAVAPESAAVGFAGSEANVTAAPATYVVQAGDSVFGIASRMVGDDSRSVADYAERMIELNMGREMGSGQRFTDASFIDVGWHLELPMTTSTTTPRNASGHVVAQGESLWSIADDELGDGQRWPELFDANQGRTFDDGRTLSDPDLIQPGWDLAMPAPPLPIDDVVADPAPPSDPAGVLDGSTPKWLPTSASKAAPALPENVWEAPPSPDSVALPASPATADDATLEHESSADQEATAPAGLVTMRRAAMLSAGVLALLAARRAKRLRQAPPRVRIPNPTQRQAITERSLRATDSGERLMRVDVAVRAAALPLIEHGQRVVAVLCAPDGEVELLASGAVVLPSPWRGDGPRWILSASTPIEMLAADARRVAAPCPALVQLGVDAANRDVYVDLEAVGAIEIGGDTDDADAIVASVATTLAASVLAEVTTLVAVGVPDEAFVGHRLHHPSRTPAQAMEVAVQSVGSTATMTTPTFELRARATAGETWEPAVVLLGSTAGTVNAPSIRNGVALVSAAPIHGPSSRLAPEGDEWVLRPAGICFRPIGLSLDDVAAIAELTSVAELQPVAVGSALASVVGSRLSRSVDAFDSDHTIYDVDLDGELGDLDGLGGRDDSDRDEEIVGCEAEGAPEPVAAAPWELLVQVFGAVDVIDRSGGRVEFERSKTRELVAWLATHRDRSTRSNARTALWENDVRDGTFANVVSEARRSLARLVPPPEGDEWVGRTQTDALPLHPSVLTDADLIERALIAARLQAPAQAVDTLGPAVELIAGLPFAGTSYLWPDAEGLMSNLVLLAISATTELGGHCLSLGDIEGVFKATGRGLRVLPGHEELIGLRMRAHARAGDHAGVRQEWESYERTLTSDPWSDGEPSPKLVELRQQLLNPSR